MKDYVWTGQITAPVAVVIGVLACFWGYRLVKLVLGVVGFAAAAVAVLAAGSSLAPGHSAVVLVCALIVGILGAILCIWLFYVGIFVLGATAGTIVSGAV